MIIREHRFEVKCNPIVSIRYDYIFYWFLLMFAFLQRNRKHDFALTGRKITPVAMTVFLIMFSSINLDKIVLHHGMNDADGWKICSFE